MVSSTNGFPLFSAQPHVPPRKREGAVCCNAAPESSHLSHAGRWDTIAVRLFGGEKSGPPIPFEDCDASVEVGRCTEKKVVGAVMAFINDDQSRMGVGTFRGNMMAGHPVRISLASIFTDISEAFRLEAHRLPQISI